MLAVTLDLNDQTTNSLNKLAESTGRSIESILRSATQHFLFASGEGKFLSRNEVCELLRVSPATLTRMMKRKANPIPHTRYSSHKVAFYEPEILRWVTNCR